MDRRRGALRALRLEGVCRRLDGAEQRFPQLLPRGAPVPRRMAARASQRLDLDAAPEGPRGSRPGPGRIPAVDALVDADCGSPHGVATAARQAGLARRQPPPPLRRRPALAPPDASRVPADCAPHPAGDRSPAYEFSVRAAASGRPLPADGGLLGLLPRAVGPVGGRARARSRSQALSRALCGLLLAQAPVARALRAHRLVVGVGRRRRRAVRSRITARLCLQDPPAISQGRVRRSLRHQHELGDDPAAQTSHIRARAQSSAVDSCADRLRRAPTDPPGRAVVLRVVGARPWRLRG